jgi:hypothetical protein
MVDAQAEEVVAGAISAWASPLERVLLGTDAPGEIVALLDGFCVAELEGPLQTIVFYRRGVGAVFGVVLRDGRHVVVKVHRLELIPEGLDGVRRVQERLADLGLPAPRPLGRPITLGLGIASAEEMLTAGRILDAHDADVRRLLADGLARFVAAATPMAESALLPLAHPFDLPPGELWPPAHDLRFDLRVPGGEWIDEIGKAARAALEEPAGPTVIGHTDWRVENLRFDTDLAAIFDWDSVKLCPEPALVGANAAAFTGNWSDDDVDPYPSVEEIAAFIADYEMSRGSGFTPEQRRTADAASLYCLAYNARCEFSDASFELLPEPGLDRSWRSLLRGHPDLSRRL